jgi:hypothetical protein
MVGRQRRIDVDYYPISEEQIKSAKDFWGPRYGRELSDDEAREIIRNVEGFFGILLEAAQREMDASRNQDNEASVKLEKEDKSSAKDQE